VYNSSASLITSFLRKLLLPSQKLEEILILIALDVNTSTSTSYTKGKGFSN
jgi:hypothetical protein